MNEHGTCSCRTVRWRTSAGKGCQEHGWARPGRQTPRDRRNRRRPHGRPRAADMIMEATLAVKFDLTVDDIIDTVHPFPTFSEAFKQTCQTFRRDTSKMSCCIGDTHSPPATISSSAPDSFRSSRARLRSSRRRNSS